MMIPTLFSVSYAGLWGQHRLDLKAFIRKAAALGYPAVELMGKRPHLSAVDTTADELKSLRDTAAAAGIEIAAIAAYPDFTAGSSSTGTPLVEMQLAYVKTLARMAKLLGAKHLRLFTGYTSNAEAYETDWNTCVKAVRECAVILEDFGLIAGVQNHHDVGVSFEGFLEFLNDVDHPNCKAMFDPWSIALHGENLRQCARLMAPRMIQTTLADYVKLKRFAYLPGLVNYRELPAMVRAVPLGRGFLDLEAFFTGLKEGGFKGYVAYETCSPLRGGGSEANLDRTISASLATIQKLIHPCKQKKAKKN